MKISKRSAQQIVEEIGKLVKQNINLMDETGRIIASNDHARIGNFHTGAYRIIQNHLSEYYITPERSGSFPMSGGASTCPLRWTERFRASSALPASMSRSSNTARL